MDSKAMVIFPGAFLILLIVGGFCVWGLSAMCRKFGVSKTLLATLLLLPALAVGTILLSLISYRSHSYQSARELHRNTVQQQVAMLQDQRAFEQQTERIHQDAEAHIERARRMAESHTEISDIYVPETVQIPGEGQPVTVLPPVGPSHAGSTSAYENTVVVQTTRDWMFLAVVVVIAMLVLAGMIGASVYLAAQGETLQWRAVGSKLLSIAWVVPILVMAAIPMYMIAWKIGGWSAPAHVAQTVVMGSESPAHIEVDDHGATAGRLPDWVSAPPHNNGRSRVVVVSSRYSPAVDTSDTERAIAIAQTEVYNEAVQQIRAYFGESYPVTSNWPIPDEVVRRAMGRVHLTEKDVDGGGKVYRRFAQVNLTPGIRQQLLPQWQKATTQERLWALCAGLVVLTLLTGTTAGYLRLTA